MGYVEVKRSINESFEPNQQYYLDMLNGMSFAACIYPENEERCWMPSTSIRIARQPRLLSPSNYSWVNYTDDKLESRFIAMQAARRGTDLHNLAHEAICLGELSYLKPTLLFLLMLMMVSVTKCCASNL